MQVLIPHGISPTGFGLVIQDNGCFRPISPCCGVKLEYVMPRTSSDGPRVECDDCGADYWAAVEKYGCSVSNNLGPVDRMDESDSHIMRIITRWAGRVTGYGDQLEITLS